MTSKWDSSRSLGIAPEGSNIPAIPHMGGERYQISTPARRIQSAPYAVPVAMGE